MLLLKSVKIKQLVNAISTHSFSGVKVGLSHSKKIYVICLIKSPLKMIKCFLFHLKKLFPFSKNLSFCHDFLVMQEKRLDQKDKADFKTHHVTIWFTNNGKNILPNISQSKDNQTMKFGQLIEYNKINIFLQKLFRK